MLLPPIHQQFYIWLATIPANASFVSLARNSDINDVVSSVQSMEGRFNHIYHYPCNTGFSDIWIPQEHWVQPGIYWQACTCRGRQKLINQRIIYGDRERPVVLFFYRHGLLKPYKYYWRIEPDIKYFCDLGTSPSNLHAMNMHMLYSSHIPGFNVSLFVYPANIPTLWNTVKDRVHPGLVSDNNAIYCSYTSSDDGGETYNRCQFWSNFEIGDLDLWRSEAYSKFFDFLDKKGPFQHCPQGVAHTKGKCWCDPKQNFDSCLTKFEALFRS
ncbi:glycosyltransferase family 15 protein [Mycena belliarum]|uniref:Glycosyltransferase family 15 protein n=1 Tax=Mycena belliarum TaxID=1033014 RepID=A0AAD6UEL5_9AGAR|nr:glycosyltransferase family 15 protein [Mycena belliae]